MLVFRITYSIVSDSFIHCLSYIRFVSFITCLNDVSSCFGSSKITVRFQWRQLRWWWRRLKKGCTKVDVVKRLSKKDSDPLHSLLCFLHHFNSLFSNVLLHSNVCSKAMEVLFWRAIGPYPRKEDDRAREESS